MATLFLDALTLLAATLSVWQGRRMRAELKGARREIIGLSIGVNGRMDELMAATEEIARLKGVGSERQAGAERAAAVAVETAKTVEKRTAVQVVAEVRALQTNRGQTAEDAPGEGGGGA